MTDLAPVIAPDTLVRLLQQPGCVVFDCRFSLASGPEGGPDAGRRAYAQAHIPGARYAHLEADLSNMNARDHGRHPWPDDATFARWLGRMGVSPDSTVVAYDAEDGAFAARLWCLLRLFGHEQVAVLDGGFSAWIAAGHPIEPGTAPEDAELPAYPGQFDRRRLLDAEQVQQALHAQDIVLVDARAPERFLGGVEPLDRVAGHVPGAVNRPYKHNLDETGRFKSPEVLAAEFEALRGDHAPDAMVAMCGSGVTACHHLLAMAHANLPSSPRLFTGSWSGWIADPARPVATGQA